MPSSRALHWDLFCRVVDNFGDIGVCWRLAADLASRGERVRLWVDDASALAWMAPDASERPGIELVHWTDTPPALEPGDVVVEAFGCNPPEAFVARMARRTPPPRWINLEYLSAESYVERSHGLPSPQLSGPGAGLVKRFHYPGFTAQTGGLIREPGLLERQQRFDGEAWLRSQGMVRTGGTAGERVVSLFCYANNALPALLDTLGREPTLLVATAGLASVQIRAMLGPGLRHGALRAVSLPPLTQLDYDHLLWACDLNFVRGEDSFVRAQWAGKPFVWHIYPQADGAHLQKLDAFLDRMLHDAPLKFAAAVRHLHSAWNDDCGWPAAADWPDPQRWLHTTQAWRDRLAAEADLATQLLREV